MLIGTTIQGDFCHIITQALDRFKSPAACITVFQVQLDIPATGTG